MADFGWDATHAGQWQCGRTGDAGGNNGIVTSNAELVAHAQTRLDASMHALFETQAIGGTTNGIRPKAPCCYRSLVLYIEDAASIRGKLTTSEPVVIY